MQIEYDFEGGLRATLACVTNATLRMVKDGRLTESARQALKGEVTNEILRLVIPALERAFDEQEDAD